MVIQEQTQYSALLHQQEADMAVAPQGKLLAPATADPVAVVRMVFLLLYRHPQETAILRQPHQVRVITVAVV
jgi:hypothetical protein